METLPSIDEAIDTSLNLLERGAMDDTELVATWVVDNLVHVLDEFQSGSVSRCTVAGYDVCRIGEQIIVSTRSAEVMGAEQARMLATALLRAAEAADQEF